MNKDIKVITATANDKEKVSHVLAKAFLNEEFWSWAIDYQGITEEIKLKKLEQLFNIQQHYFCLPYQSAYYLEGFKGAALWSPPHQWELSLSKQIRFIPQFVKIVGWYRLIKVSHVIDIIQKKHPKKPHYYLQNIGVDPLYQGQGLSSKLLMPMIKQCDSGGIPIYLETATEQNIALYRHFGFEIMHILEHLPYGAPKLYCMWRTSRGNVN